MDILYKMLFYSLQEGTESEVDMFLKKKFAGMIADIAIIEKEDLDLVCVTSHKL